MKRECLSWWVIAALGITGVGCGQSESSPSGGEHRIVAAQDEDEDEDEDGDDDDDLKEEADLAEDVAGVDCDDALTGQRTPDQALTPGGPAQFERRSHPLGFSVALPHGWRIHAPKIESVTLISGDGSSVALVRGFAGIVDPARWLTREVLKGESIAENWKPIAVDGPTRGITRAAFDLVGEDGIRRRANGFVIAGNGGATAMIAAAPPERYTRELPVLAEILYSFRIEGRPPEGGSAPAKAGPSIPFVSWRDPNEGAFTLDTPKGWSIEGGVFRPDLFGTRSGVTMVSPEGRHVVWLHDPSLPRIFVHVPSSLRGLGPAQPNYVDYQDGPTFAAGYIQHRFGQARVERVTPLPTIVQRLDALGRSIGKANEVNTAASVDFRLADGRVGVINVAVSLLPNGFDDGGTWNVAEMCGFVSAPDQTAVGSEVLQRALSTFVVDPRWFAGELQGNRAGPGDFRRLLEIQADGSAR